MVMNSMNKKKDPLLPVVISHDTDHRNNDNKNDVIYYHSNCDPSLIPTIAQDMTWIDPHFNNADNIIAVFDIHPKTIQRYVREIDSIAFLLFVFFLTTYLIIWEQTVFHSIFFSVLYVNLICNDLNRIRTKCRQYRHIHIAIATDGIYIDECDLRDMKDSGHANSTVYGMHRVIIPYTSIDRCHVHNYRSFNIYCRNYRHVSFFAADGTIINSLLQCFDLYKFVEIVNGMIEQQQQQPSDHHNGNHPNHEDFLGTTMTGTTTTTTGHSNGGLESPMIV